MNVESTVAAVANARSLDARVTLIRKLPQDFGSSQLPTVYAEIARQIYAPTLDPDFAYVHWLPAYEFGSVKTAYKDAFESTKGFTNVDAVSLSRAIQERPRSVLALRLILGLTVSEFAESTGLIGADEHIKPISKSKVESAEGRGKIDKKAADAFGKTIDLTMSASSTALRPGCEESRISRTRHVGGTQFGNLQSAVSLSTSFCTNDYMEVPSISC